MQLDQYPMWYCKLYSGLWSVKVIWTIQNYLVWILMLLSIIVIKENLLTSTLQWLSTTEDVNSDNKWWRWKNKCNGASPVKTGWRLATSLQTNNSSSHQGSFPWEKEGERIKKKEMQITRHRKRYILRGLRPFFSLLFFLPFLPILLARE
jgi:hypothetical protein